jgi:hypothetical protein
MGDATPTPLPPFAAAVLQSMLTAAQQDLTRLTACKPPAPGPHAVALQQMLTAVRARVRRDSKSATADQATQAAIDPETMERGVQTDKDIGGFDGHMRALTGQQALAVREKREALATQQKEHHTYRHALRRILKSIEALQSQNAALAANAECVWRLAQSRGLLDSANGGLHSAWSGELQLPNAFGYTAETDTKRIKE